jgi:recombination protein RecA
MAKSKKEKVNILSKYPSSDSIEVVKVDVISSGSLSVDFAFGVGGFPRGRITEVVGAESSGKTSLCLSACAEANKAGLRVAYFDTEYALDWAYADTLGISRELFHLIQPDTTEECLDSIQEMAISGEFAMIVLDSVAAISPHAEVQGESGDSVIGVQAKLMNQAMRKLPSHLSKSNTACVIVNQWRSNVGSFAGPTKVTTGGKALQYAASVRIDIWKSAKKDKGYDEVHLKFFKNKLALPHQEATAYNVWGRGFDNEWALVVLCEENGIIKRKGAWYSFGETQLAQGAQKTAELLRDNPELFEELKANLTSD